MIKVQNLSLTIDGNVIFDNVSFHVKQGEYIGLIGPNGAGKTSLIKTLLGLYKPTKGNIIMSPEVIIGYVPQRYTLSSVVPISVKEVLLMSGENQESELIENLKKVELGKEFLTKNFHHLSGGQQQRVIITRALCKKPHILIFDEPLTGVDFSTKIKLYELLSHLNDKENLTILFVSHEVDHIIDKCQHILCLNKTMHTGCHPMDFAKGKINECPVLETGTKVLPIHHHHSSNS